MAQDAVQVILKAATILDALSRQREMSASELAEQIGEPRSSVYRLLASLQRVALVENGTQRGTYRLGLRLLQLGNAVVRQLDLHRLALPVMERLHDALGETTFLCVRRGREAVCIERLDGRRVTSMALQLGGSLPLHTGAAPRALLAFLPPSYWHEYATNGPLEEYLSGRSIDFATLEAILEETRRRGYSISDGDVVPGIASVGAPIFEHRGTVAAALSMSGLRAAILGDNTEQVVQLVMEGALEISRSLGFGETSRIPEEPLTQSAR